MSSFTTRCGIALLIAILGSMTVAGPVLAEPAKVAQRPLSVLDAAARTQAMHLTPSRPARRQQAGQAASSGFFKTRKGAVVIGLMAAGAGFTLWSINHDRKPVKSPVR